MPSVFAVKSVFIPSYNLTKSHNTKVTTWVDPRTYATRKHGVGNLDIGELPYGWEEDYEETIGHFYIEYTLLVTLAT